MVPTNGLETEQSYLKLINLPSSLAPETGSRTGYFRINKLVQGLREERQEIHKATMMFRCLHGLAPKYLCSKFTWCDSAYDLRDSENKLNVPLPRTNYYRKSFSYNGATLWNSLPCDIRNTESLGVFKRKINDIL